MRKGIRNIKFDGREYKLLGRGGEANVYSLDEESNLAIKVYRSNSICYTDPGVFAKEMYVIRFLKDIEQIQDHVVDVLDEIPCDSNTGKSNGFVFMELYDGDLDSWARDSTTRGREVGEDEWVSMIFQVAYAFMDLNSRGVIHGDPKPKNIFYTNRNLRDPNADGVRSYLIEGKSYQIPFNTRYVLGDFSRVRVAEFDLDLDDMLQGQSGTPDLYFDLTHRSDLYELSRLLYRVMVNTVLKTYSKEKIENLIKHHSDIDKKFEQKIAVTKQEIQEIDTSHKIKDRMLLRFYAYELIEGEYITQDQLLRDDLNLILPSERVQQLLRSVSDPNIEFETLFESFIND
jgi:serine/threonine protein kinase